MWSHSWFKSKTLGMERKYKVALQPLYLAFTHEINPTWPHLACLNSISNILSKYAHQIPYLAYLAYLGAYLCTPNMVKWCVPEKKSCKMQFRRINLVSIGPPSQKLWPNPIFGWFPHFNYDVKLEMGGRMLFKSL